MVQRTVAPFGEVFDRSGSAEIPHQGNCETACFV